MHHRAVSVAFNVVTQALVGGAPHHLQHLVATNLPLSISLELLQAEFSVSLTEKINKSISKANTRVEVDGKVYEVVPACETVLA